MKELGVKSRYKGALRQNYSQEEVVNEERRGGDIHVQHQSFRAAFWGGGGGGGGEGGPSPPLRTLLPP